MDEPVTPVTLRRPTGSEDSEGSDFSGSSRRLGRLLDPENRLLALVVVSPLVLLLALRVTLFFRLNNGDPFIYVGYANAFQTHVGRFGYTYHSVRFGLIFPLRASLALGPVLGYFVLRYVLYLLAIVPMYFVLRPLGRRAALLGPVLFVSSPVAAAAILTTHPDTIVVPSLTLVTCLYALALRQDGRRRLLALAIAGVAAGVAMNANVFATPLFALFTVVLIVFLLIGVGIRQALLAGLTVLLGVIGVSAAGAMVYQWMFNDWDIFTTTWNAMRDISGNNIWKSPSFEWMSTRRYIYVPVACIAFATVGFIRRRRSFDIPRDQTFVFVAASVGFSFFVVQQFLLKGSSMEHAYYFSYVIGPMMLLLGLAASWHGASERGPTWLVIVAPVLLAYLAQLIEIKPFFAYVGVSLLLLTVALSSTRWIGYVAVIAVVHVAWGAGPRSIEPIAGAGFQYEPHYERAFGGFDDLAYESYLIASQLPSVVPSGTTAPVPLLFWYRTGDALLDSVQATYHWETSAVQRFPDPGMPVIGPGDLERLRTLVAGYVVLLATDDQELASGRAALEDAGFRIDPDAPIQLKGGDSSVLVQVTRVLAAPG